MIYNIKNTLYLLALLSVLLFIASCTTKPKEGDNKNGSGKKNIVSPHVVLADPFILLHDSVYYAYGTSSDNGLEVYCSDNLKDWKRQPQLILDKKDSYGEKWFWAPEVYYNSGNKKFYLYYSAEEHICVATSDSPLGPFAQDEKKPMLDEKAIDSSLFIDDDGTPYLYFVRFTDGNVIWAAELEADWVTIKEQTLKQCIVADTPWETDLGKVAEGPSVVKKDGLYYLIYSANDYHSQNYGVGFATSASPLGDWIKSDKNPILAKPGNGLVGTGHGAIFRDKKGKGKYVFHAHFSREEVQPRLMHTIDIEIGKGEVKVDKESIVSAVEIN
ncbi:glycoside hydrolase family 43 protein [Dysgonomonas sp. 511]|uniref:glycoside hydrolase family 43 protein n=1 Tax=Dysgonomonas sp. 511 TaxID=2302930 RepID=UPI0013D43073|nr:glycoside hydrolase family 43 protein [Dysgonomonas sp. 511]NDV78133.1 1,4-beta-xylanase [Dysgonomonas sp. 511]